MKVTDWVELAKTFPTELKMEARKVISPEFERNLHAVLSDLHRIITNYTEFIDMTLEIVRVKAWDQQIMLNIKPVSCSRAGCGTCLGKHPYHYPYFQVKIDGKWRTLSTRRLHEFLMRLGLTERQVQLFDRAVWARHRLIAIFHGLILTFNHLGITDFSVEAKTKEVQIREG